MSIADKLVTIAENEQRVYDAGYEKGKQEGGDTETAYSQGFDAGKQAEYDEFWDAFQPNKGAAQSYEYAFCGSRWNDITFKPKYDIVFALGYSGMNAFYGIGVTNFAETLEKQGVKMDTTLCGYWTSMFQNINTKRLPELNCSHAMDYNSNGLYNTFFNSKIETIDKMIVVEELKYTNTFKGCANLKNIIFEGVIGNNIDFQDSTLLTHDSLMNIIERLKDFSGTTTTRALTLGSTNLAKLTDAEKAIATQKGWTLS